MGEKERSGFLTAEDRYYFLAERITSRLDDPIFKPLHDLLDEINEEVRKIVGDNENIVRQKIDKILRGAIESRITRQLSSRNGGEVRPHRNKRRILDWRNL